MPNNTINYDQTDAPGDSCEQGQVVEELISVPPITVRRKTGRSQKCSYLIHWVQVKPEQIALPDGETRIRKGRRNLGCIVVCLDYPEEQIYGVPVAEMTHPSWVRLLERLGVFTNVYARLGVTADELKKVGWNSESPKYFYRNQFVTTHWKLVRIMEEHPNLKVVILSLSELLAAALETAQEE